MNQGIGICAGSQDVAVVARAGELARELSLALVEDHGGSEGGLVLQVSEQGLMLRETGRGAAGGIGVDFGVSGPNARRLATAGRRQPLARAVGLKPGPVSVSVIDATAGLGRDAAFLASLGCRVTAIERSPVLGAMWRDAMDRAGAPAVVDAIREGRLTLQLGDAVELLSRIDEQDAPDVVYLDPMYPSRGKSALPKKEMRILRRLVGDDTDAGDLLKMARRVARQRVVVKRNPHGALLGGESSMTYGSKLVRYDVYSMNR